MDKRRRIKFILLIAVSVFAVLFIAAIVIFVTGIYSSKVSEVLSLQKLYPNTFQTVDVYVDFGNIQVLPSYDTNVHLTIYSDSLYNVDTSDNTLSITSSEKGEIPFLKTKSLVQIYLPDMAYQKVSLVSNCGDVSIDQFTQTGFEIDGTLGDVTVTQARSLSVFTDFGDLKIGDVGNLSVEKKLGDTEATNVTEKVSIDKSFGDISIENLSLIDNSAINLSFGNLDITSISNASVDASSKWGDVSVEGEGENDAVQFPYQLTIKNKFGSIRVA